MTWTDPNSFRIDISLRAYQKMMAAVATTAQEVSGFGVVRVYENYQEIPWKTLRRIPKEGPYGIAFRIEDVWLLDHGSSAETTIDQNKAGEFYAKRMAEGYRPQDFKLWWHRHPLTGGWSGTDEYCIGNTPMGNSINPASTGWMVSLVWCTETGWNARFDQLAHPNFTIHTPVTIDNEFAIEPEIQAELAALTRTTHSVANTYWNPWSGSAMTASEPIGDQLALFGDKTNDLPWWGFMTDEIEEISAGIRDALLEIEWGRYDETVALAFIEDVVDQIERRAKIDGGIDQADIEDIVINTARRVSNPARYTRPTRDCEMVMNKYDRASMMIIGALCFYSLFMMVYTWDQVGYDWIIACFLISAAAWSQILSEIYRDE